jgi:hypothetical protein
MKHFTVLLFVTFLAIACKNGQQPGAENVPKTDTVSTQYYPVADFFQSEIRNIDTTVLAILSCRTIRQRTDTAFLTANEFNRAATAFLTPELNPDSLEKNYTENSFADKTTGYVTFIYSARDKGQPLQRIDVLLTQGEPSKVKSIYMERADHDADTLVVKKMYWAAGHSFQVISSHQSKGHPAETRQWKVVWNDTEDN